MRAHGHGGNLTLIGVALEGTSGEGDLIAVRFKPNPTPTLETRPPPVAVARARVPHSISQHALSFVASAMAAEVHVQRAAPVGTRQSIEVQASTHDERIQLLLQNGSNIVRSGAWQGYVNSLDEPRRAPLDLAWNALSDLLPGPFAQTLPDVQMKQLFASAWSAHHARTDGGADWVEDMLLELAATLGTPELAKSVAAQLTSPRPRRRLLAVNALSGAVTGRDLRRDSAGAPRPLDAITADYLKLYGAPDGGAARD